ncbi:MAG: hypothetical protein ABEH65_01820, partial [Halobacteriales archaeon]
MNSNNVLGNEASVDAQPDEQGHEHSGSAGTIDVEFKDTVVDETVERERNLRPTVEMGVQARIDTNHPDAGPRGLTLAAEERLRAREAEIERTRTRWDRHQES